MKNYVFTVCVALFFLMNSLKSQDCILADYPFFGNAVDMTGNGFNGNPQSPTLTNDRFGTPDRAYLFDGSSDKIVINNNQPVINTYNFSITAWVNMYGLGGGINHQNCIFSQRDNSSSPGSVTSTIGFFAETGGNCRFNIRSSTPSMVNPVDVVAPRKNYNEWHFYAAVKSSDSMFLYIDSLLVGLTVFSDTGYFNQSIDYVEIGTHTYSNMTRGYFNGVIDDVKLFDCPLSYNEILSIYNAPVDTLDPLTCISNIYDINCFNGTDGAIDLFISGGVPPYLFSWSNGYTLEDLVNIGAGNYSVTITDSLQDDIIQSYVLTEPTEIQLLLTNVSHMSGYQINDGSISVFPTGGIPPYSYLWSTGQSTNEIFNLSQGQYDLTITDYNDCFFDTIFTILSPLSGSSSQSNVTCFGYSNGSINISISGGISPYSFYWSNGVTDKDLYNLSAGSYDLTIIDSNSDSIYFNFAITEPNPISIDYVLRHRTLDIDSSGFIQINVFGGTSPYKYKWSTGDSIASIYNLNSGDYFLTISDENYCHFDTTFSIFDFTGINSLENNSQIEAFPNPFNDEVEIIYKNKLISDVLIFNMYGQIIRIIDSKESNYFSNRIIWDGKNSNGGECNDGLYFIVVEDIEIKIIKKVVLSRN